MTKTKYKIKLNGKKLDIVFKCCNCPISQCQLPYQFNTFNIGVGMLSRIGFKSQKLLNV